MCGDKQLWKEPDAAYISSSVHKVKKIIIFDAVSFIILISSRLITEASKVARPQAFLLTTNLCTLTYSNLWNNNSLGRETQPIAWRHF